jgi:hypothetical protein
LTVNDNAAVIAARNKLAELQSQLESAKREYAAAANMQADSTAQRQAAVDAILNGADVSATAAPNVAELRQRVNLLSAAVDRQARNVAEAEHVAGLAIAKAMEGEHATALGELAKAVAALRDASERYFQFCCKLSDSGAKHSSLYELLPFIGQITRDAPTWLANAWLGRLKAAYPKLARGL